MRTMSSTMMFTANNDSASPVQFADYREELGHRVPSFYAFYDWYANWIGQQRYIGRRARTRFFNYFDIARVSFPFKRASGAAPNSREKNAFSQLTKRRHTDNLRSLAHSGSWFRSKI